ncbi:MAG TPA: hypothetical protein VFK35_03335 [Candidatus Limnocylindrales bacterium]|nr:hypothetical protein [Candidatus Limnocylindrales bacterium]
MTERRGDQGFSVAPSRVDGSGGGWRGPRRRLTTWMVLAAAAAVIVVAVLGPRLQQRPNLDLSFLATPTPTPRPSATPTLRPGATPRATPLPALTRGDGPVPPGTIAILTERVQILDPTVGTVLDGLPLTIGQAAIVRATEGTGWTCVCLTNEVIDRSYSLLLRIVDLDENGEQSGIADPLVLGPADTPDGPASIGTGIDVTDDAMRAIVVLATRQTDDAFLFSAAGLSLVERPLPSFREIARAAGPPEPPTPRPTTGLSPEPGALDLLSSLVYVDGPYVRIAPDGSVAFAWARLRRPAAEGPEPTTTVAWRIALGPDASPTDIVELPELAAMAPDCDYAGFVTADRFGWLCPIPDATESWNAWALQLFDLDGGDAGRIAAPEAGSGYLGEPLMDRANGAVYAWDPTRLVLLRFDVARMSVEQVKFDPAAEVSTGVAPGGGTNRPDWHDAGSINYPFGYGEIAAAADGSRMYLVGFREDMVPDAQAQASLGIFVVDRATLALVDRWAPTANYQMLSMVLDDRAVAASSFAGAAPDGRSVPWESSLTLHDPADGRVVVQFGRLGFNVPPIVIER